MLMVVPRSMSTLREILSVELRASFSGVESYLATDLTSLRNGEQDMS